MMGAVSVVLLILVWTFTAACKDDGNIKILFLETFESQFKIYFLFSYLTGDVVS